jgi:hypothetical protein
LLKAISAAQPPRKGVKMSYEYRIPIKKHLINDAWKYAENRGIEVSFDIYDEYTLTFLDKKGAEEIDRLYGLKGSL